jgi:hypothetical protein
MTTEQIRTASAIEDGISLEELYQPSEISTTPVWKVPQAV